MARNLQWYRYSQLVDPHSSDALYLQTIVFMMEISQWTSLIIFPLPVPATLTGIYMRSVTVPKYCDWEPRPISRKYLSGWGSPSRGKAILINLHCVSLICKNYADYCYFFLSCNIGKFIFWIWFLKNTRYLEW